MNRPNTKEELTIINMTRQEVDVAIEWAKREGWNPGVHDAECFYQADSSGFYAAKLNGEIAGTISLVKYSRDFVFEGLYIVKPEYRGKGVGTKIQKFALDLCREKNLGLDGVTSMQQKYSDYGLTAAYNNVRYRGIAQNKPSPQCIPIGKGDFNEVATYDLECFGFDRARFLSCWLSQNDAAKLLVRNSKGAVSGYGVIRKCGVGHKIGPLFADSAMEAELLFNSLNASVAGETFFLDVPDPNVAGVKFAIKRGLSPVFNTVRMFSKGQPDIALGKVFGVTTFELG